MTRARILRRESEIANIQAKLVPAVRQLMPIVLGSALFASIKAGLVLLIATTTHIPPWLNYLLVIVGISLLGWVYHSKVSFKVPLTRRTLVRYVQQAVLLKITDYMLYTLAVYVIHIHPAISVLVVSAVIFVVRVIVYIKYVYASAPASGLSGP